MPNPTGQIATAMNAAVKTARHEIITRIDAHSMLPDGYLRTAVRTLMETGAADVGGWMAAEGITPFQRAVAWAMTSPFGMGRRPTTPAARPGRPTPSTSASTGGTEIEQVGGYDETMLIAEDWELNYRIRAAGGLIWFTPDLKVTYRPRATPARPRQAAVPLRALAPGGRAPLPGDGQPALPGAPVATALNAAGLLASALAGPDRGGDRGAGPRSLSRLGFAVPALYLAGVSRGRRRLRPGHARRGPAARARGARRDAHLLGRRVPDQPASPCAKHGVASGALTAAVGQQRAAAAAATARARMRQWALISPPNSPRSAARGMTCTPGT